MKKFAAVASTLAILAALGVSIQPASAESLYEAMAQAYMSNPTLRAARAGQRATDELVPQALSGWRPSVSVSGEAGLRHYEQTVATKVPLVPGPGTKTIGVETKLNSAPGQMSIALSQPVFDGFKTISGTKAAEATVAAGQQNLLATEQDVLFQTAKAYFDVIRDRKFVSLRRQNLSFLQEELRAVNERLSVGEVTRTDVAQSEARVSAAQATLANAQSNLADSSATYLKVVGSAPGTLKYPKKPKLPASLPKALALASETNPNLLASALVEEASVHQIEVVKGNLLPSVSIGAQASTFDDLAHKYGYNHDLSVFGQISVPLYEGGYVYSQVRQAKQIASQQTIQVIETNRAVREAVAMAWNSVIAAREMIVSEKAAIAASTLALEGVRQEYQVGTRTTLDVLNAQAEVLVSQLALAQTENEEFLATYQLIANIGHLTADHLALGVEKYDPNENYRAVRDKWIGTDVSTVK